MISGVRATLALKLYGDNLATLDRLSDRERTVVVMRHYLDLSEAEVARTLGCSVGTVKSTCSRALQRLRIPSLTVSVSTDWSWSRGRYGYFAR